ncbi:putative 3-beta hydroxysteroid dehydrogenase protein [Rosellinia necatrix]|uniref:Putative 3-beta hydroxysteroid dehydrogenase protein n=1 Tax=Rosellinia necatrix TaxID=77044 RepID=A0A1W2TMI6_ROSNE|nr:putative 3-beta hydroxysteroid dehydrogenase protein [Rosellinia necatrix]
MAPTLLVTGASGLIGFRILRAALEAGLSVRYTVRSEEKARIVASNPSVARFPGGRLSPAATRDLTVDGAFDAALEGITHVIHAGAPVPVPTYHPAADIFRPTVGMASSLLASALRAPAVRRVVVTSSILGNLPLGPRPPLAIPVSAATRVALPDPFPAAFDDVYHGYILGKIVELRDSDEFARTREPHFGICHVNPGYVFGRNELVLDATMMQTHNSSNKSLMMAMLGVELPFPLQPVPNLGGFAHIDDVADVHLRVAFLDKTAPGLKDFGVSTNVNFDKIFDHVEETFPEAVAAGIFKRGKVSTMPLNYDSSETEHLLGRKLKLFSKAVIDVARQYLERIGADKSY